MINQFLFKNEKIIFIDNLRELQSVILNNNKFLSKYKKYTLVFGFALGMGHEKDKVDDSKLYPMYQLYGIALVDDTHLGIGRKVSKRINLEAWQVKHAVHRRLPSKYAVSNDILASTLSIKDGLKSENIQPIKGIIVDTEHKLFILTGVLPDDVISSKLNKLKEDDSYGSSKSKNENDTV